MERMSDTVVERLVRVISDGGTVRWEREIAARPDLREVLESLRGIESLTARLHRSFSLREERGP